jgi:hypothetical protein
MARRGPSHNFVKMEKERKRLKKAAQKNERRQLKKQQTDGDGNAVVDDSLVDETELETAEVEADASDSSVSQ